MDEAQVLNIIQKHDQVNGGLIAILQDIQSKFNYLPEEALKIVARETDRSLVDIFGMATFYKFFSLKPRGKHLVSACLGTACHVRGGPRIASEFEHQLGIRPGETTEDKEFSLETVNCLGACALGPVVVVDGHYFSNVNPSQVQGILKKAREGMDRIEVHTDERVFPLQVNCPRCNHTLMDPDHPIDGHPSIRVTISFGRFHGWLRLSSLYGSFSIESEQDIPQDMIADFFCPHCHTELSSFDFCPDCNAPMVHMIAREGGIVDICSRRGCKFHMLDLA